MDYGTYNININIIEYRLHNDCFHYSYTYISKIKFYTYFFGKKICWKYFSIVFSINFYKYVF